MPFDGELTCEHLDALSPAAYRCGQVWGIHIEVAGMSFYHQGSANLLDDDIRHRGVDVFLAGIAGRSFTRDYWRRILARLEPRTVVASHFDDFFRPLEGPMGFSLNVNLSAFPEEVAAVSSDFAVAAGADVTRTANPTYPLNSVSGVYTVQAQLFWLDPAHANFPLQQDIATAQFTHTINVLWGDVNADHVVNALDEAVVRGTLPGALSYQNPALADVQIIDAGGSKAQSLTASQLTTAYLISRDKSHLVQERSHIQNESPPCFAGQARGAG